jgi:hypothetical protein
MLMMQCLVTQGKPVFRAWLKSGTYKIQTHGASATPIYPVPQASEGLRPNVHCLAYIKMLLLCVFLLCFLNHRHTSCTFGRSDAQQSEEHEITHTSTAVFGNAISQLGETCKVERCQFIGTAMKLITEDAARKWIYDVVSRYYANITGTWLHSIVRTGTSDCPIQ